MAGGAEKTFRSLAIEGLPAGEYAVHAKAQVAPNENDGGMESISCSLEVAGQVIDYSGARVEDGWFGLLNLQATTTIQSGQKILLRCTSSTSSFVMSSFQGDTKITAIRVANRTQTTAAFGS